MIKGIRKYPGKPAERVALDFSKTPGLAIDPAGSVAYATAIRITEAAHVWCNEDPIGESNLWGNGHHIRGPIIVTACSDDGEQRDLTEAETLEALEVLAGIAV